MAEQESSTPSQSHPSPPPGSTPPSEETAASAALKPILWFLLIPIALVLLIKWLVGV